MAFEVLRGEVASNREKEKRDAFHILLRERPLRVATIRKAIERMPDEQGKDPNESIVCQEIRRFANERVERMKCEPSGYFVTPLFTEAIATFSALCEAGGAMSPEEWQEVCVFAQDLRDQVTTALMLPGVKVAWNAAYNHFIKADIEADTTRAVQAMEAVQARGTLHQLLDSRELDAGAIGDAIADMEDQVVCDELHGFVWEQIQRIDKVHAAWYKDGVVTNAVKALSALCESVFAMSDAEWHEVELLADALKTRISVSPLIEEYWRSAQKSFADAKEFKEHKEKVPAKEKTPEQKKEKSAEEQCNALYDLLNTGQSGLETVYRTITPMSVELVHAVLQRLVDGVAGNPEAADRHAGMLTDLAFRMTLRREVWMEFNATIDALRASAKRDREKRNAEIERLHATEQAAKQKAEAEAEGEAQRQRDAAVAVALREKQERKKREDAERYSGEAGPLRKLLDDKKLGLVARMPEASTLLVEHQDLYNQARDLVATPFRSGMFAYALPFAKQLFGPLWHHDDTLREAATAGILRCRDDHSMSVDALELIAQECGQDDDLLTRRRRKK